MNTIHKKFITLLMLVMITSCGFHLRGMTEISFKTISIEGKDLSFTKNLKKTLTSNKVAIVDFVGEMVDGDPAHAALYVHRPGGWIRN